MWKIRGGIVSKAARVGRSKREGAKEGKSERGKGDERGGLGAGAMRRARDQEGKRQIAHREDIVKGENGNRHVEGPWKRGLGRGRSEGGQPGEYQEYDMVLCEMHTRIRAGKIHIVQCSTDRIVTRQTAKN